MLGFWFTYLFWCNPGSLCSHITRIVTVWYTVLLHSSCLDAQWHSFRAMWHARTHTHTYIHTYVHTYILICHTALSSSRPVAYGWWITRRQSQVTPSDKWYMNTTEVCDFWYRLKALFTDQFIATDTLSYTIFLYGFSHKPQYNAV
jgi:hypothetical protein